ncbi:MAG: hypothetical protein ACLPXB_10940, partial [Thiobacillaceae bacterium]
MGVTTTELTSEGGGGDGGVGEVPPEPPPQPTRVRKEANTLRQTFAAGLKVLALLTNWRKER